MRPARKSEVQILPPAPNERFKMSVWNRLKDVLNEEEEIPISLINNKFSGPHREKNLGTVAYSTVRNYLKTLEKCGFVYRAYKDISDEELYIPSLTVIVLKYKIPKRLTYKEARKLSKNPWMVWFKYPQIHTKQGKESK